MKAIFTLLFLICSITQARSEEGQRIHLHLNKTVFIIGEQIGFSTYLFNASTNKLLLDKHYIYVQLRSADGKIVDEHSVLSTEGQGTGTFLLPETLTTGIYTIQAFTLTMNAYSKDTSFKTSIRILDFENQVIDQSITTKLPIETYPESGVLLESALNRVALRWNKSIEQLSTLDSIVFIDHQTKERRRVYFNKYGYGNFSYIPKTNKKYSVVAYEFDREYEIPLPKIAKEGYGLTCINHAEKNQFIISVKRNNDLINPIRQKPKLVIKNSVGRTVYQETLNATSLKDEMIIDKYQLQTGVHTISLIGKDNQVVAQRKLFNQPKRANKRVQLLNVRQEMDSVSVLLKINTSAETQNMSVSALPVASVANRYQLPISASLLFAASTQQPIQTIVPLLQTTDSQAQHDLDVFLIMEPIEQFVQEKQLKPDQSTPLSLISGYANIFKATNDSLRVMLYGKSNGVFDIAPLDKDKKFKFKNIALVKDSEFTLTLIDKNGQPLYANFFIIHKPKSVRFKYPYEQQIIYSVKQEDEINLGMFKKVEQLDEVEVSASKLKREEFFKDYYGINVKAAQEAKGTLASYIASRGYRYNLMDSRYPDPRRAARRELYKIRAGTGRIIFPALVVDGFFTPYAMDFAETIRMDNIDEIYYRRMGLYDGGTFVVFTKNGLTAPVSERNKNAKTFISQSGYDITKPYVQPDYISYTSPSFKRYGVNAWLPQVGSSKQGIVSLKLPKNEQQAISLFIEGITVDGDLISETLTVDLNK